MSLGRGLNQAVWTSMVSVPIILPISDYFALKKRLLPLWDLPFGLDLDKRVALNLWIKEFQWFWERDDQEIPLPPGIFVLLCFCIVNLFLWSQGVCYHKGGNILFIYLFIWLKIWGWLLWARTWGMFMNY